MAVIEPVDVQKVAEENPNSRFRITNAAILNPGVCFVCGSAGGDGRQFVDYGKTIDFYGVVYVCTFCVAEVADMLGFGDNSELMAELDRHEKAIVRFGTENAELQEQVNAARILLRNCHCDPDSTNPTVLDSLEADPEPEPDNPNLDESGYSERPDDIPPASSDDEEPKPKRRTRTSSPAE